MISSSLEKVTITVIKRADGAKFKWICISSTYLTVQIPSTLITLGEMKSDQSVTTEINCPFKVSARILLYDLGWENFFTTFTTVSFIFHKVWIKCDDNNGVQEQSSLSACFGL